MNANIYGRSQIFETEKRKSRKKIRNKNACRVACIWTCRRYAVGCSGRCTEHDVTVRCFVEQKYLDFSDETKKQIEANGEDKYQTAKETVKPEENQALYYTLTSVKEGSPSGEIRESMLEFASQFIGNPYVWGGTSLTDGADCSGFVQQIYKQYGYSLPRVAEDQSQYGTKIPVEDAQPGDLIFYAKEGYVYHVVMYAGDGRTIEAASTKLGIIEGKVNTKNAVWATRILKDDYSLTGGGIEKANATEDMYGQKLENYTFSRSLNEVVVRELISITASQLSAWSGEYAILKDDLEDYMKTGFCCVIFAGTHRGAQALVDDLNRDFSADLVQDVSQIIPRKIYVMEGTISAGMEYPQLKLAVISHTRTGSSKAKPARQKKSGGIKNISDLNVGDYVVHVSHGIGIFEGIVKRDIHGVVKDYIQIRYAGSDMLFVPVTQLDLVTKYIGGKEDSIVKLNKLNSAEWAKTRARVKKAVKDMADELIKLYAQRAAAKGYAFSQDTDWQNDFERRFPYDETDDQLRCIQEIKEDMEKPTPMDRLLCGDVGFGKTEVAIRAAFKCVMDSKQCAVLVPTTILAWQHYQTFRKRMEGFPIKVDILSRFRTPREQEQVLEELRRGEIDVLVGTHRLVQKDVRFKDLGLCIIDEEQRFGVKHKETFKEMRNNVDVLTLSATPIPRTLNMAMSGIRDMSTIEEAPQDRQPVQTYVMEHDWGILTQAMNKELRRGGQVFYLHNRVDTIDRCAATIQQMIPDATVVVAHGKMSEEQLSKVWKRLIDHEIDILVCTTIIETGVDVSNCNTLIIEDADRLGLSQLYQIRGRVGRSSRRAFAYLTVTKGKALTDVATKRLEAIREFTTFGSGFRIAMRDLEIRGAGNILGAQQHGHMEAVGYEMYLKMLSDAVAVAKGEKPDAQATECLVDIRIGAHIPEDYIESLAQRIDIYKKIASVQNEEDAMDITDELIDRFGEPPEAVKGLIDVSLLRNMAAGLGIREISQRTDSLLFYPETVDMQAASRLAAGLKGRVMLNAGAKPYLAVKVAKGEKPIDTMRLALFVMAGQDVAEAVQKPQKKQPLRGLPPKPYRD